MCSAHANALQIVTVTFCMKLLQNGRLVRFSKRTDCRYAFSWSIGRQSGQLIWLIQSSRSEGYDSIHKSWEDIISCEEQWPKPKTKWNGSPTLKRTVSKNHKITAANVTVELKIHLEDTFSTKTVGRELHKSNIHVTAATAQPLIIEKKTLKSEKDVVMIVKNLMPDDWKYAIWSEELSFRLLPASGRADVGKRSKNPMILNA